MNIRITQHERDSLSWAIDGMRDYWEDAEERDGDSPIDITEVLTLHEKTVEIRPHPELDSVLKDLLYRLEKQALDVATDGTSDDRTFLRACRSISRKIRKSQGDTQ